MNRPKAMLPRILIIEEKKDIQRLLEDSLKNDGYEVEIASSFPAAIKRVSENHIEAIITDFESKSANALEVIKKLKKVNERLPVFAITGTTTVKEACGTLRRRDDKYRYEAINVKELRLVLSKALDEAYMSKASSSEKCKRCLDKEYYRRLSIRDGLTGLYNNIYFKEYLDREVKRAQRYKREVSIIMLDIDNFKDFNDAEGHLIGDETLKIIAGIFLSNIRNVDFIARYGGEEFVMVLPETSKADAACCAARIREAICNRHFGISDNLGGKRLTVSLGVANCPIDAHSAVKLIERADHALYEAKELGKNRICIFCASS